MKKLILSIFVILFVYQIGVSQTENYQVYALKFASMGHPTPVTQWAQNAPPNDSVNIDFMIWLIKGNNGRNVLVDAGFLKDLKDARDFGFINYIRPDSMLLRLSLQAKDITDIILSHPHWDHIDGVGLFPNARIWMQKEDFNYFTGAAWQKDGKH